MKYSSLIVFVLLGCAPSNDNACPSKKCSDYVNQAQAQDAFDKDKACLSNLDADKDGQACEELNSGVGGAPPGTVPTTGTGTGTTPGTGTTTGGCPTTSNCGCSGKKKADCTSACCKWIVGSGCNCS